MKFILVLIFSVLFTLPGLCQQKLAKSDLVSKKDKLSYCIGLNIGKHYKSQINESDSARMYSEAQSHADVVRNIVDVDSVILAKGIDAGFSNDTSLQFFTEQEINEVLAAFQKEMSEKQKAIGDKNRAEGTKYLEANKKKPGVITTASGLQYKIVKPGMGKSPKATDSVTVHYTGTLIDGTKFDSSVDRNEPITFPVTGVIKGWIEALQLMKEGDIWELYIPSDLAYGETGANDLIGPNTVLCFTVELIKVK